MSDRGRIGLILSILLIAATVVFRSHGADVVPASRDRPERRFEMLDQPLPALWGNRVAAWEFNRDDDRNFDGWPDQWKRRYDRQYPRYVDVALQPHHAAIEDHSRHFDSAVLPHWQALRRSLKALPWWLPIVSPTIDSTLAAITARMPALPPSASDLFVDQYLRVKLDGGGAFLQSDPIPVSRMYGYTLSVAIRTEALQWDVGWGELIYLDAEGRTLQTVKTPSLGKTHRWKHVRTEATGPPEGCRFVVIRLRVEPTGNRQDIRGWVGFDRVQLHRYPQLQLSSDHFNGFYPVGAEPTIRATALGLSDRNSIIQFRLYDVSGQQLLRQIVPVSMASDPVHPGVYAGDAQWQLPKLQAGYYRVVASLRATDRTSLEADVSLAVIEPFPQMSTPFGWTLPDGAGPIPINDLPRFLSDCHVGWMKYPCWTDPADLEAADRLAWLMAHVQERGIQAVGLIDQPPVGVSEEIDKRSVVPIANALRDGKTWQPLLEPQMSRLTLKVRRWQLGRERDFSFLSGSGLQATIAEIAAALQGYGPPLEVAISWPWLEQQPPIEERSWTTVVRSEAIPLTAGDLDAYLAHEASAAPSEGAKKQWLLLDPLPASQYKMEDRVRDLVFRMATVRGHDVSAAFVRDPFDPEIGLLRPDGSPSVMLLPWRTTSAVLGSLQKVGSLQLPGGSHNILFSDSERTVMMVWNESPTTETLYLGDAVETIDVWGHREPVRSVTVGEQTQQRIRVDTLPTFVVGLDPLVARFRMGVRLADESIDSLLGRQQTVRLIARNPTDAPLTGDVRLDVQDSWHVSRFPTAWQAQAKESETIELDVTLQTNATTGMEQLDFDFSLHTVPARRFTVYRQLHVGPIGLQVHVTTRLNAQGNLVVRLEMVNEDTVAARYDCRLFPAGRQYQRRFLTIGGGETVRREFVLADGEELLGTTLLLRASEEGGRRVLNYTVRATR